MQKSTKQKLLLLEDVDSLGKKGEVVTARAGYIRNFLFPRGMAVPATVNMLRKQERLKQERVKQAEIDRAASLDLVKQIETIGSLEIKVKVDPEGHMYGSVSAADIALLFQEKGLPVERKYVQQTRPIKATGVHEISLKLKEGVMTTVRLAILPEDAAMAGIEDVTEPLDAAQDAAGPDDLTPPDETVLS